MSWSLDRCRDPEGGEEGESNSSILNVKRAPVTSAKFSHSPESNPPVRVSMQRTFLRAFATSTRSASHVGCVPVAYPASVTFQSADGLLTVNGPKGSATVPLAPFINLESRPHVPKVSPDAPSSSSTPPSHPPRTRGVVAGAQCNSLVSKYAHPPLTHDAMSSFEDHSKSGS